MKPFHVFSTIICKRIFFLDRRFLSGLQYEDPHEVVYALKDAITTFVDLNLELHHGEFST